MVNMESVNKLSDLQISTNFSFIIHTIIFAVVMLLVFVSVFFLFRNSLFSSLNRSNSEYEYIDDDDDDEYLEIIAVKRKKKKKKDNDTLHI